MIIIYNEDNNVLYQLISDKTYRVLNLEGNAYVELDFIDKEEMRALNLKERNIDKPTDVLSFPFLDKIDMFTKENYPNEYDAETEAVALGTIVVCAEIAKEQAEEYGHNLEREKSYLFLHGLLHLLGFDHEAESEKSKMRETEEQILSSLNLTR